jgi:hypothetical protein
MSRIVPRVIIALAALVLVGGTSPKAAHGPGAPADMIEGTDALPIFNASNFVSVIDNPYLAFTPGKTFFYSGKTKHGTPTANEVEVTRSTRVILGVTTTVVHDRESVGAEPTEETFDWYAQDRDGNVWCFGEDSKEYRGGKVVSTEGSWEAGKDGAMPAIAMLAKPAVGVRYAEESAPGARDMAEVVALDAAESVPFGHYTTCLKIKEWEPGNTGETEFKFFVPNVGLVLESLPHEDPSRMELVRVTP